MIIASNKDRDLAIKALNGINSQDKNQILDAVNIVNELLHKIINSAAMYNDLQNAKLAQLRANYSRPFLEINDQRMMFCSGSAVGDLAETLTDFCLTANSLTTIYDDRSGREEVEEEDEEEDEDEDEDEEDDPF